MLTSLNSFKEFFFFLQVIFTLFLRILSHERGPKRSELRHKRIHPCVLPTPSNLSSSRYITKSFWGVQGREVKSGEESWLEIQPYGRETQKSNCRMSELEETFRTSKSHHVFSFTDGETQVQRGKGTATMSHSNSVSELGPEPTSFNPSLGAFCTSRKEITFSTTGWGGGRSLRIMACPHFTELYSGGVVKLRTL